MSVLRPDKIVSSPARITPQMLGKLNVTALFLDLDGTLAASRGQGLSPEMLEWVRQMQSAGITLFILSNNKSAARVKMFAETMNVPFAHRSRKPRTAGFFAAAKLLGLDLRHVAMVGDQIFTDTLGANCAGARSILVEPICDRWYHKLRRIAEIPFRKEK